MSQEEEDPQKKEKSKIDPEEGGEEEGFRGGVEEENMEIKRKEKEKKLEKTGMEGEPNFLEEKDLNGETWEDGEEVQEDGRKEEEGLGIDIKVEEKEKKRMNKESNVKPVDLEYLGRIQGNSEENRRKKERNEGKRKADQRGNKRRQRGFVDQWANWKDTERRRRRSRESKKTSRLRNKRKESLKETGESIQRRTVNKGKFERDRQRKGEKEGEKGEKAMRYTVLGVKSIEKDVKRRKQRREELRPVENRSEGRKQIGLKTKEKQRVWRARGNVDGNQRRSGRVGKDFSMNSKRTSVRERGKGRYQRKRREQLSRRRIQSRSPWIQSEQRAK